MELKYKVGDEVIITKGNVDFVADMEQYIGKKAIIKQVKGDNRYGLDIDGGSWTWNPDPKHNHFKLAETNIESYSIWN